MESCNNEQPGKAKSKQSSFYDPHLGPFCCHFACTNVQHYFAFEAPWIRDNGVAVRICPRRILQEHELIIHPMVFSDFLEVFLDNIEIRAGMFLKVLALWSGHVGRFRDVQSSYVLGER